MTAVSLNVSAQSFCDVQTSSLTGEAVLGAHLHVVPSWPRRASLASRWGSAAVLGRCTRPQRMQQPQPLCSRTLCSRTLLSWPSCAVFVWFEFEFWCFGFWFLFLFLVWFLFLFGGFVFVVVVGFLALCVCVFVFVFFSWITIFCTFKSSNLHKTTQGLQISGCPEKNFFSRIWNLILYAPWNVIC